MTHRIEETIARGMCIGCGACSVASGGAIPIRLDTSRLYQADLTNVPEVMRRVGSRVCPFSDEAPNEDELQVPHVDDQMESNKLLGSYTRILGGRVNDDDYIWGSSSGGLTSWLIRRLINAGVVDAALSVGRPGPTEHELFGYDAFGLADIRARRKSCYYAATMSEVLKLVASSDLRFALVGVPCYVKAARTLCIEMPELAERIVVFIGLVCGHYKTQAFAESLAWQIGIPPDQLDEVDFRVKDPARTAGDYKFGARAKGEAEWNYAPTRNLVGGNWGHNAFQPEACNFCDDVVAECADISFGDAWLPQFEQDPRGTNIVISRNRALDEILDAGAEDGEILVFPLTASEAAESQAGGFRHRRAGLALRLADDQARGLSTPRKRVVPDGAAVAPRRAALIRQRRRLAAISHIAFMEARETGDLGRYLQVMSDEIAQYRRLEGSISVRLFRRIRRIFGRAVEMILTHLRISELKRESRREL